MSIVSRLKLDHPALGTAGGSSLHASIEAIYTKIGNNISTRVLTAVNLNDSATATVDHDFLAAFADLKWDLYLYDESTTALTRVTSSSSPSLSQFTVAANGTNPTTQIDITNNSGAQRDLALVVSLDPLYLSEGDIKDIDVTSTTPQDGQALVYEASSGKFKPGASGDASFKLQAVSTPNLTLKGGTIIDGDDELSTYDGSGSASTDYGADLTLNLTTILGSSPADATTYFLFVDKLTLGSEVTFSDNGNKRYGVVQANFVLSTTRHRDTSRYVYVGFIKSATTGNAWSGTGSAFGTGAFRRHDSLSRFFYSPETYSSAITTEAASTTLTHNLSGKPQSVLLTYFDGTNEIGLEPSSYLRHVSATQIVVSSLGLTFGGGQELRVQAVRIPTQTMVAAQSRAFVSGWMTSTATTTLPHGLNDVEDIKGYEVEEWNVSTGRYRMIDRSALVSNFDATNFYLDWTGLSPTVTLQYRVVAGGSPLPYSLSLQYGGFNKFVGFGSGSYGSVTAALAAAQAGDSILVTRSTSETAELSVPAGVSVHQMPNTTVAIAGSLTNGVRLTGARAKWTGMNVQISPTGAMSKGVSVEAADCWVAGHLELATAQTLTDAVNIAVGGARAYVQVGVKRTLGTITNLLTNNDGASNADVWGGT